MDFSDILSMGTKMLQDKVGDSADSNSIQDALSSLLGNEEGGFDLSNIMSALTGGDSEEGEGGGLADIVSSWIGSGENKSIDGGMLSNLLGSDKISEFAQKLGIDEETAASGLADALPNIVDKATPEGESLLDQVGGLDGLMSMAGKLFGKS